MKRRYRHKPLIDGFQIGVMPGHMRDMAKAEPVIGITTRVSALHNFGAAIIVKALLDDFDPF